MRIPLTIELFQHGVSPAVTEEHDCLPGRHPPDNRIGSAHENALRQNLWRRGLAEIVHQLSEHLWCDEMPGLKACFFSLVDDFVQSHEWMPVGEAVIAARSVHQQDAAQPEFLTGADVDAGVHRQSPG